MLPAGFPAEGSMLAEHLRLRRLAMELADYTVTLGIAVDKLLAGHPDLATAVENVMTKRAEVEAAAR